VYKYIRIAPLYTVTVENDCNGTAEADKTTAAAGETITLTATPNSGYHFKEWQSSDVTIRGNTFIMPEKNVTVTAIFEADAPTTYTVTFNMNGHGTQVADQTVEDGNKATKPADPTAEGWTFSGWYKDASCISAFDFNTPITADTVVYAKWSCVHATTKATTTKATLTANGKVVSKCSVCGKTTTKTVYIPKTFRLSATKYTYNGKVKKPSVTVKDSKGTTLKKGTDYTVTYACGRKSVGTYKETVKGTGKYRFTKTLTFKINPAATKIVSAGNVSTKSIKVKWSKAAGAGGYQVMLKKGTKTVKKVKITKSTTLTKKVTKLAKGSTYRVYVRSYKTVSGTNYYSAWSAYKSVKISK
ncbi:MAG: InlB B-repeat-containing protein, partial [Clostridia bacterium]|nr:InlB B-repeat-containing protein [Clostridia bacterium]